MTARDDLAAKLLALENQMAAAEKRAVELEAKLAATVKAAAAAAAVPEPFKSDYQRPANPTDRASMDKSARDEIAKTFDAGLVAGLHADAHPNAYYSGGAERLPKEPAVERGSGFVDPSPLWPPAGVSVWGMKKDQKTNREGET